MSNRYLELLKYSLAGLVLPGLAVSAETQLEEIVVTAQKREQSIKDVPFSVMAVGREFMESSRIQDFSDLAFAVPSLSIPERGGAGDRYIFLRGMGSIQGSTPLVGVYFGEASVTGFPGVSVDLQTYDLARVEVLRGPQGTLYGVGSMGGTIRFIPEEPDLKAFAMSADFAQSYTKGGDPSHDIRAMANIPLVDDTLGLRVAGVYRNAGGWMDQPAIDKTKINDRELVNVRGSLLWLPSDAIEINATAVVHRSNAGAPNTGEDEDGNYTQAFFLPTTPSGEYDFELYNLTGTYDFGSVQLLSSTSYLDLSREQLNVGYRVPFGTAEEDVFHALFDQFIEAESFTQELRLSSSIGGPLDWIVGVFYRDAKISDDLPGFRFGPPTAPFGFDILTKGKTESWAVFGELSYDITPRLEVGAGIRYFEDSQVARDFIAGTRQSANFDAVSPRVFASFNLTDEINLYANASRGFRSGGLVGGLGVVAFEPDTIWSYEAGSKMSLLGGRLSAELALFYSEYEDVQVTSVNLVGDDLLQFTANVGSVDIKGVDWNLTWRATDKFSVGLGGEIIDTEFVKINAQAASHAVGDEMDFIPEYHYTVWGRYNFTAGDSMPGFLRVDYSEKGRSRYGNRTICECYESYSDVIEMLNLSLGVQYDSWSVMLFGRNLLNDRGYIDAESIEEIAARSRPRTVGVQVGFAF